VSNKNTGDNVKLLETSSKIYCTFCKQKCLYETSRNVRGLILKKSSKYSITMEEKLRLAIEYKDGILENLRENQ